MRRIILATACAAACALGACGDNNKEPPKDGGPGDGTTIDAGPDAPISPFAYCIDRPPDTLVPRPPTPGLPCDMFPPAALH